MNKMEDIFKEISTETIKELLDNAEHGFSYMENALPKEVIYDYRKHFDLHSRLSGYYGMNRGLFDKLYPSVKNEKYGEMLEIDKRFKRMNLNPMCDGMISIHILLEELRNRELKNKTNE